MSYNLRDSLKEVVTYSYYPNYSLTRALAKYNN